MLANFRTEELVWDKASSYIYESYRASTSDERGRRLLVRIVNGGHEENLRDYDLSLAWEHENNGNSGLDAFEQVGEEDGVYELYYTTGMLSNFGKLEANLFLTNGQESITSEPFIIEVFKGINMESVESSDSFSTLTEYVARLKGLEGNFNQWEEAENARVVAEDGRVASENERVTSENERSVEYTKRANQESERVNSENLRVQAEADREASEGNRVTAEEGRVLAEEGRESAEQERVDNENARNNTEADVIESESLRKEAELGRVNAEDGRVTSENLREQEYSTRLANEDERVLAEQGREVAEADREASEGSRITAEQGRESAEADREANEGSRVTAEQGRELAEQGRDGRLTGIEYEVRGVIQEKIDEKVDGVPEGLLDLDSRLQDVDSFVEMVFDELYEIEVGVASGGLGTNISLRSKKQDSTEGEDEALEYGGGRLVEYLDYVKGVRLGGFPSSGEEMFKNTIVTDLPKFIDRATIEPMIITDGMFEGATLNKPVSISDLGVIIRPMFATRMFQGVRISTNRYTLDLRDMDLSDISDAGDMFKNANIYSKVLLPPLKALKNEATYTTGIFEGARINLVTYDKSDEEWLQGKAEGNSNVTIEYIEVEG